MPRTKKQTNIESTIKKPDVKQESKVKRKHITVQYEAPPNWELTYSLIEKQRSIVKAPVDEMGCASLHDANAPENVQRYQILISLMLSSQTRDEV